MTTKRTDELQPGDTIVWGPFLNEPEVRLRTVTNIPEPWILTAGRYAGQQATNGRQGKGDPLLTVHFTDDPTDGSGGAGAPAGQEWTVQ